MPVDETNTPEMPSESVELSPEEQAALEALEAELVAIDTAKAEAAAKAQTETEAAVNTANENRAEAETGVTHGVPGEQPAPQAHAQEVSEQSNAQVRQSAAQNGTAVSPTSVPAVPAQTVSVPMPAHQASLAQAVAEPTAVEPATADSAAAEPTKGPSTFFATLKAGLLRFPELLVLSIVLLAAHLVGLWHAGTDSIWSWYSSLSFIGYAQTEDLVLRVTQLLSEACLLAMFTSLFARVVLERKQLRGKEVRPLAPMIVAAVSFILVVIVGIFTYDTDFQILWMMIRGSLIAASVFGLAWQLATPENEEHLFARLIRAPLFTTVFCWALSLGLALVLAAIDNLVISFDSRFYVSAVLVVWSLVYPNLLASRLPRIDEELDTPKSYRLVASYVVLSVCLLLLAVLYIYIAQIAITQTMPSGQMNWFGSIALAVYLALWLGLRMVETPVARIFVRWGWLAILPVLGVQIWGIIIRVSAYGLTSTRYLSLACLAVGIIGLVLAAVNAHTRPLYLVAAIMMLVVGVSPFNILDVPNFDQNQRLEGALEQAGVLESVRKGETPKPASNVSDSVREQASSSWDYLRSTDQGYYRFGLFSQLRERIHTAPVPPSFEKLFGFDELEASPYDDFEESSNERSSDSTEASGSAVSELENTPKTIALSIDRKDAALDVSKASKAYHSSQASIQSSDDQLKQTLEWTDGTKIELSLDQITKALQEKYLASSGANEWLVHAEASNDEMVLELDNGQQFVFENMWIDFEDDKISDISFAGWLFIP